MRMMDEMREIHAGIVNELEGFRSRDQILAEELISIRDKQRRFEEREQKFEETQRRFDESAEDEEGCRWEPSSTGAKSQGKSQYASK